MLPLSSRNNHNSPRKTIGSPTPLRENFPIYPSGRGGGAFYSDSVIKATKLETNYYTETTP